MTFYKIDLSKSSLAQSELDIYIFKALSIDELRDDEWIRKNLYTDDSSTPASLRLRYFLNFEIETLTIASLQPEVSKP